jgi:hypothetical protein
MPPSQSLVPTPFLLRSKLSANLCHCLFYTISSSINAHQPVFGSYAISSSNRWFLHHFLFKQSFLANPWFLHRILFDHGCSATPFSINGSSTTLWFLHHFLKASQSILGFYAISFDQCFLLWFLHQFLFDHWLLSRYLVPTPPPFGVSAAPRASQPPDSYTASSSIRASQPLLESYTVSS